jgi:hypothetical protein
LGAPVIAGASAPMGAPVAGVLVVEGGGTWTLFRGSSCAETEEAQKPAKAIRQVAAIRRARIGPCGTSERWRSGFMGSHQGMMKAILARSGEGPRFSTDALVLFDVASPKSVISSGIQSSLSDSSIGTST